MLADTYFRLPRHISLSLSLRSARNGPARGLPQADLGERGDSSLWAATYARCPFATVPALVVQQMHFNVN